MFKKLISNLPFHPSLLGEVAFYVHRLRQEAVLRRAGLILVALTLVLQMFAIFSPSKASLATSSGDIIYGASSRQDVLDAYHKNQDQLGRRDIQAIYNYYGIGAEQIKNAQPTIIKDSNTKDYVNTTRTTTKFPDTFVKIPGASDGGIYEFPLRYWDTTQYPNGYPALKGKSTYGFTFWILLKGCGNIVFEKGTRKPDLDIVKNRTTPSKTNPGDKVTYKIQFRNSGFATANDVKITDKLDDRFEYVNYQSSVDLKLERNGQHLTWTIKNKDSSLPSSDRWHTITLTVKAKEIAQKNVTVCNESTINANNSPPKTTGGSGRCVTIEKPLCPGTGLPLPPGGVKDCTIMCPDGTKLPYTKTCKTPQLSCHQLSIIGEPAWNVRKLQTTIVVQPGGAPKQIDYYVNNKKVSSQPMKPKDTTNVYKLTLAGPGTYDVRAVLIAQTGNVQASQGCSLTETIEQQTNPQPRLTTDKAVSNLTQKIADANGTTAKAGDTLRYTISIENTGDASATLKLEGEYGESIADILEYADLTDKGDANFNETTGFLSWGQVTINPDQKIEKQFSVRVKDPIPATPTSLSNPLSYDFIMHNKYGRDVNVNLDKPVSKVVEQTATTLPNTGPGTSLIISMFAAVIVGYFFFRSRLLAHELEIVHHEYSAGGM